MSLKTKVSCIGCGDDLWVESEHIANPVCHTCRQNKQKLKEKTKNVIKSVYIKAEIKEDSAVLGALMANASAFHTFGGFTAMAKEHFENGADALKVLEKLLKQNSSTKLGTIRFIYDNENERILVIDNGTGIEDPFWIVKYPLLSRKGIFDLGVGQVGKRGRGLHGFRGFCKNLTYYSFLENTITLDPGKKPDGTPKNETLNYLNKNNLPKDAYRCCKLELEKDSIITKIDPVTPPEFHKYSNFSHGTIAIFSGWLPDTSYEELKRKKSELIESIQHHFRHDLETGLVEIIIEDGKKIEQLESRAFESENGPLDEYKFPDDKGMHNNIRTVFDKNGNKLGTIEYVLYKVTGEYKHRYKKPYLIAADNRPLQDSFIAGFGQMSNLSGLWKSPYVTGYVKCDFIHPDDLRVALSVEKDYASKNKRFWEYLGLDSDTLKKLVSEFQAQYISVNRTVENQNIMTEVQSFLVDQKVDLNLPDLTELGILKDGDVGSTKKSERISDKPGKNKGRIVDKSKDEVVVFYEKDHHKPPEGPATPRPRKPKKRWRVNVTTKDGRNTTTMLVDRALLSSDGRRRKETPKGVNLVTIEEELNLNMSSYDPNSMAVEVNLEHSNYDALEKLKKKSC